MIDLTPLIEAIGTEKYFRIKFSRKGKIIQRTGMIHRYEENFIEIWSNRQKGFMNMIILDDIICFKEVFSYRDHYGRMVYRSKNKV